MEPTIIDLLTASGDDDLRSKAQILAQSLRGDRQLGMMGQIGGKRAAGLGREMLADTDAGEKAMLTAGTQNRALDFKQQKLVSDFDKAMAVQSEQTRRMLEVQAARNAGSLETTLARLANAQNKEAQGAMKEWGQVAQKYNPGIAAGRNPLGLNQNLLGRADRIRALVDAGNDPDVVITSQLVRELEMGLATLAGSSSGQLAKSAVDEIANKTFGRSAAEALQYLSGQPQDARAKPFVKQALITLGREHRRLTAQQRGIVAPGLMARGDLLNHPAVQKQARAYLESVGAGMFSPEDVDAIFAGTWRPEAEVTGAESVGRPAPQARIKELRALGKDPEEIKIIMQSEGYK